MCSSDLIKRLANLSKTLPWYLIPIGVESSYTNLVETNTALFWKMHNTPKYEEFKYDLAIKRGKKPVKQPKPIKLEKGISYTDLLATYELGVNDFIRILRSGSSALVMNHDDNSLINILTAHFASHGGNVYVIDFRDNEDVQKLAVLNGVRCVANNLQEAYEVIKWMLYISTQRYAGLMKLGIKHLPLNNVVHLGSRVVINGTIMNANERLHTRIAGDDKDIIAQDVQPGMEVVIAGQKVFRIPNHWEIADQSTIQIGGDLYIPPILFIFNGYDALINTKGDASIDTEMRGFEHSNISDEIMRNEIIVALDAITRFGKQVNIHTVITTNTVNDSILPVTFKDVLDVRISAGVGEYDSAITDHVFNMDGNHVLFRLVNHEQEVYVKSLLRLDRKSVV